MATKRRPALAEEVIEFFTTEPLNVVQLMHRLVGHTIQRRVVHERPETRVELKRKKAGIGSSTGSGSGSTPTTPTTIAGD